MTAGAASLRSSSAGTLQDDMFWRRSHEGDEVIQVEGYSKQDRRKETGVGLLKRTAGRGKPRREEALGLGGEEG